MAAAMATEIRIRTVETAVGSLTEKSKDTGPAAERDAGPFF